MNITELFEWAATVPARCPPKQGPNQSPEPTLRIDAGWTPRMGATENSPAIQRRVGPRQDPRPVGTPEPKHQHTRSLETQNECSRQSIIPLIRIKSRPCDASFLSYCSLL